ncbi:MAG: DUF167 domain-containing protein [Candidatus Gastranaerophilales bacterium]|nr:DUF167 domain-containing protein [Candidatus Gastranaerophilales bacterium]
MDIEELKHLINNSKNDPAGGFKLKIKVSANSKKDSFEFLDDDPSGNIIKIKISKPAVDGKANKAIIEYLSEILNLPKSNITILNGEKSSQKCLLIRPKANIIKNI